MDGLTATCSASPDTEEEDTPKISVATVGRTEVFKCPKCDKLYYQYEMAEACCSPKFCKQCNAELPLRSAYITCSACRYEKSKSLATIVTVDEYFSDPENIMIFDPGMENYGEDMDELLEHYDDPEDVPEYMWGTKAEIVELSVENALEDFLEHASTEDRELSYGDLVGLDELRAAVAAFNEDNRTRVYYPDKKVWVKTTKEQ